MIAQRPRKEAFHVHVHIKKCLLVYKLVIVVNEGIYFIKPKNKHVGFMDQKEMILKSLDIKSLVNSFIYRITFIF
jgi:hypothetical protein